MRKKFAFVIIALIGLGSFAALGNSSSLAENIFESIPSNPVTNLFAFGQKNKVKKTETAKTIQVRAGGENQQPPKKIPAQVTYLFLFREVAAFEEKAVEAEKRGENALEYRAIYQRAANLTAEQSEVLRRTAIDCAAEVKAKDAAAKKIGNRLRAEYQAQLNAGTAPATPPASTELTELQKQRDEIIFRHRDLLKENFGEAFPRFEEYVTSHITSNITTNMENNAVVPAVNMDRINNPQPRTEDNKEDE